MDSPFSSILTIAAVAISFLEYLFDGGFSLQVAEIGTKPWSLLTATLVEKSLFWVIQD
jgi:hypothetical protein